MNEFGFIICRIVNVITFMYLFITLFVLLFSEVGLMKQENWIEIMLVIWINIITHITLRTRK